jgi:hypothetical protein
MASPAFSIFSFGTFGSPENCDIVLSFAHGWQTDTLALLSGVSLRPMPGILSQIYCHIDHLVG